MEDMIKNLEENIANNTSEVKSLIEKRDEQIKAQGQASEELAKKLDEAGKRLIEMDQEKKALMEKFEGLEGKINRIPAGGEVPQYKTAGQTFVGSEEFKSAVAAGRTSTAAVDVGSLWKKTIANSLRGDGEGRAPVWPERVPELFYEEGQREITIRDIMNVGNTMSNSIRYYKETGDFAGGDAAAQNGETNTKEQLKMDFEAVTDPVQTIAAWLPVSRQVLDDSAELQSHIDSRLRYKVLKEYEDQVLFGDGVSGALVGLHNRTGVTTVGAPDGSDTKLDHLRKAFARVRVREYFATAVILHPNDWAEIELLKGSDNRYVWVSVPDGGQPRLWRVPVVETTAMEEGRFLTGAFGIGAQLWEREGATIRLSESHSDYFVRNAIAVLGEIRAALAVYRETAFIKGTLDPDLST